MRKGSQIFPKTCFYFLHKYLVLHVYKILETYPPTQLIGPTRLIIFDKTFTYTQLLGPTRLFGRLEQQVEARQINQQSTIISNIYPDMTIFQMQNLLAMNFTLSMDEPPLICSINQKPVSKMKFQCPVAFALFTTCLSFSQIWYGHLVWLLIAFEYERKSDNLQYNTVGRCVDRTIIPPPDGPMFILIDWEQFSETLTQGISNCS